MGQSTSIINKVLKFSGIKLLEPMGKEIVVLSHYSFPDTTTVSILDKPHDIDILTPHHAGQTCTIGIDEQMQQIDILVDTSNYVFQQGRLSNVIEIKVSADKSNSVFTSAIDIIGNIFSNTELNTVKQYVKNEYRHSQQEFAYMFRQTCEKAFSDLDANDAKMCFINLDEVVQLSYTDDKLIAEFMFHDERTFNNQYNIISRLKQLGQTKLANGLIGKCKLLENINIALLSAKNMAEFMSSQNIKLATILDPAFQSKQFARSINGLFKQLTPILKSSSEGLSDVGITVLKPVISASGELSTYMIEKHATSLALVIISCTLFFMIYCMITIQIKGKLSEENLIKIINDIELRKKYQIIANEFAVQSSNQLALTK